MNGYFEKINGNKYLMLVATNQSAEKIKKNEELWSKIKDLIRSLTKNSYDYDEKYMKMKFHLDDELPLNERKQIPTMTIVVTAVFDGINKYIPQVVLDECLYKLWIIYKCYVSIKLTFLNELVLIKQVHQKSVIFGTIGIS